MTTVFQRGVNTFLLTHGKVKTNINFRTSAQERRLTKSHVTDPLHYFFMKIWSSWELYKKLDSYKVYKTPVEKSGLRKRRGAREQTANVSESWTAQGSTTKISICFTEYTRDFDTVEHLKMWNNITNVGITEHLTVLIRDLHT